MQIDPLSPTPQYLWLSISLVDIEVRFKAQEKRLGMWEYGYIESDDEDPARPVRKSWWCEAVNAKKNCSLCF
ncbi:hypothetical protein LguiB_008116 [Lonicera macranthoides]